MGIEQTDGQTDGRTTASLNAPHSGSGSHNKTAADISALLLINNLIQDAQHDRDCLTCVKELTDSQLNLYRTE